MRNRFTRFHHERGGSFNSRENSMLDSIDFKRRIQTAPEARGLEIDAAALHLKAVDRARAKLAAQVFGQE